MNQEKVHLINKLFNNETIRTIWDSESEKFYISVVDMVGVLAESDNPQIYWRVMKKRLMDDGNETVTKCNGLKLKAKDGKYRLTDLSEEATKRIASKQHPNGLHENIKVVHKIGSITKQTRDSLEQELGESIITKDNKLNYQYGDK